MSTKIGLLFAAADITAADKLLSELRSLERTNIISVLKPSSVEMSGTALRLLQADILLVLLSSFLFPEKDTETSKLADYIIDRSYKLDKAVVPIYLSETSTVSLPEFLFHFIGFPRFSKSSAFPLGIAYS